MNVYVLGVYLFIDHFSVFGVKNAVKALTVSIRFLCFSFQRSDYEYQPASVILASNAGYGLPARVYSGADSTTISR